MSEIENRQILKVLEEVVDPELGIDIVHLGLVYRVEVMGRRVFVRMTMTTPACPLSEYLTQAVRQAIHRHFEDVETVEVEIVWDPPWSADMVKQDLRDALGWR